MSVKPWFEYTVKIAEILLAGAALLIAVFLWNTTQDQVAEAKRATNKADSIARESMRMTKEIAASSDIQSQKSIDIAIASNNLTDSISKFNRKSAKLELRAYINVVYDSIIPIVKEFSLKRDSFSTPIYIPIRVSIPFVNSGKTPAYNVRIACFYTSPCIDGVITAFRDSMKKSSYNIDLAIDYLPFTGYFTINACGKSAVAIVPGKSVIGIGQTKVFKSHYAWPIGRLESALGIRTRNLFIEDGDIVYSERTPSIDNYIADGNRSPLYFYEIMNYEDIFGESHYTEVCIYWERTAKKWKMYNRYNESK